MQNWRARYIGGKPTLEKPTFKTDYAKPDDAKKDSTNTRRLVAAALRRRASARIHFEQCLDGAVGHF